MIAPNEGKSESSSLHIAARLQEIAVLLKLNLGRLIQHRPPFNCRMEEILDAIAESPAAVEINGDPYRFDMPPEWIREARKRGIKFVISTDAHSVNGMKNLKFGVGIARRGCVRRDEVLNTLETALFRNAVAPMKKFRCSVIGIT